VIAVTSLYFGSITSAHASVGVAATWPTRGTMSMTAEVTRQGAATTPQPARKRPASTAMARVMRSVICSVNAARAALASTRGCEEFGIVRGPTRVEFGVR